MTNFESVFTRIDYNQIGLTSNNTLKVIDFKSNILACVGDYTGSIHCFLIKSSDFSTPETLFKTLPNANSKINCVEVVDADTKSPKFLVSFGSSTIRGFNRKGKQFFGLELNNLSESIKHLKVKWPNDIYVAGQFIFNHYVISSDDANSSKTSSIQNRNCYISSGKINCLLIIEEKINHKAVTILACEDRLIRIIVESSCEFEFETVGICNVITRIPDYNQYLIKNQKQAKNQPNKNFYFCYGTANGKLVMLKIDFNKTPIEVQNVWEVNLEQSKSAIQCITPTIDLSICMNNQKMEMANSFNAYEASELCIGRADGSIEIFAFDNYINEDGNEIVNLERQPRLAYEYNCGEGRLTSIEICKFGQLIICCTFTGLLFAFTRESNGLTRNLQISKNQDAEQDQDSIEKDNAMRIEELELECGMLEERLNKERDNYQKLTSVDGKKSNYLGKNEVPVSALPYFSINDSFFLQDNSSYLLNIECEAPIDCVVFQSEIKFDLIDCEHNSAVFSLNDNQHSFYNSNTLNNSPTSTNNNQILATFRFQANITRLDVVISSIIEGQFGKFSVYVLTKVTPKSCQVRSYTIKALSLHKRKYIGLDKNRATDASKSDDEKENDRSTNAFTITGQFSLNEAYSWLLFVLPEIPDKFNNNNLTNENKVEFTFQSTLVNTYLRVELGEGRMHFESENVSTISILKDFLTREATKRRVPVELNLDLNRSTINIVLATIYDKLKILIKNRNNLKLKEAIKEIEIIDKEIAFKMNKELEENETKLIESGLRGDQNELERFYGLITDLFIDFEKLNSNNTKNMMKVFSSKINDMVILIETYVTDQYDSDVFIKKITEFWQSML